MTFMRSSPGSTTGSRDTGEPAAGVSALASQALSVLAARRTGVRRLTERHLAALELAVCAAAPRDRDLAVAAMTEDGIGSDEICDHYIPEVARRLGEHWSADRMSFAQVTIGSARLQSLLREIALESETVASPYASEVVVMVMAEEDHTLGAMVVTGQLRRLGISVRLELGRPLGEIAETVAGGSFDAILISVAAREDLDTVRTTIATLRKATNGGVPLIIGGGVLNRGFDAAKAATGADYATNDLRSALKFSGCDIRADLSR